MYQCAQEVIDTFPSGQQQRWRNALVGLRIPYFDWAADPPAGQPNVPDSIRAPTVSVIKPSGSVTIPNPLYSYSWGNSLPSEMGWGPSNGWPATLRHPRNSPPTSDNDEMNASFGQSRVGWRQRVFAIMASKKSWGAASTSALGVQTSESNSDSFESIHDEVHGTVGGNEGHMSYLDVAAFDPLFWIHHTNVDRLLAMYQLVVPDTYVSTGTINRDMAQWNAGEVKDANSPLKPFTKNTNGDFYSSVEVQETRALGYYYPETEGRSYNQVVAAINKLYGQGMTPIASSSVSSSSSSSASSSSSSVSSSSSSASASSSASVTSSGSGASSSASSGSGSGSGASSSATPTSGGSGSGSGTGSGSTPSSTADAVFPGRPFKDGDHDTVLCVQGDKYAMPGSYTVHCFLGNKPVNGTGSNSTAPYGNSTTTTTPTGSGRLDPGYVGSHTFMGGSVANSNSSAPVMVEGCIPLTAALQGKEHYGDLKSLHPDHVEPYLKENLHYKIIGPNGKEFAPEDVPNFHAKVKSCPVTPAKSGELPTYHPYVELPKVNANLPAGKPWTYTPSPAESYPSGTPSAGQSYPTGAMPWAEPGYCVVKQVIEYVDSEGKLLYSDKMY